MKTLILITSFNIDGLLKKKFFEFLKNLKLVELC